MRLIDVDALKTVCNMGNDCKKCEREIIDCQTEYINRWKICSVLNEAPTVGGWISVKDRLPDIGEVITAVKYSGNSVIFVQTGEWTGERWISIWDQYTAPDVKKEVLYWMPLPSTEGLDET